MQHTVNDDNEYEYHKDVQVEEGKEYQYKFRVGEGDWWILNEEAPTGKNFHWLRNWASHSERVVQFISASFIMVLI